MGLVVISGNRAESVVILSNLVVGQKGNNQWRKNRPRPGRLRARAVADFFAAGGARAACDNAVTSSGASIASAEMDFGLI